MRLAAPILAGTALGVLFAALSLCYEPGRPFFEFAEFVFIGTAIYAGPGALVLSVPHSLWMLKLSRRGMSLPRRCLLGATAGIPLGLLNLIAAMLVYDRGFRLIVLDGRTLWLVTAGIAGGVGLGLGCAWGTVRGRKAPP